MEYFEDLTNCTIINYMSLTVDPASFKVLPVREDLFDGMYNNV